MVRRRIQGLDEGDVFSRYWRRHYCWTRRAGTCKAVKRKANRRERREAKAEAEREFREFEELGE